jgi:hypothetical protein
MRMYILERRPFARELRAAPRRHGRTLASFIELGVAAEDALLVEGDAPL